MNNSERLEMLCERNFSRLGAVFETKHNQYFYDTGTGKVFGCESAEFQVLKYLTQTSNFKEITSLSLSNDEKNNAIQNIIELMDEEHILQHPQTVKLQKQTGQQALNQLILEITEDCNLRCKYCIYQETSKNFRTFHNVYMTWDVAKKAIDYALSHADHILFIGFYGGEPLLNFNLMRKCIDYVELHKENKTIYYSMTSNLTLMSKEIATYLSMLPKLTILCSIDGPEEIHNQYRVTLACDGSFKNTMKGFIHIRDALGGRAADVLSVNSVVCPPYKTEKFEQLKHFFDDRTIFPIGMKFRCSYVNSDSLKDQNLFQNITSLEGFYRLDMYQTDPIKSWAIQGITENDPSLYIRSIEYTSLEKIQNRFLQTKPSHYISRNGCCNVGVDWLYVTVKGNLKICEKIGSSPSLGSVFTGLNAVTINQQYKTAYDLGLTSCNDCWAVHLCNICYACCYNENGYDHEKKTQMCHGTRNHIINSLIEYHQILETNEDIMDEMDFGFIYGFDE